MIPLMIYGVVPLAGLANFAFLRRRMLARKVPHPPVAQLFVLHVAYGGLLLVVLTDRLWHWSGMASLGAAFLLLVAPLLTLVQGWRLRTRWALSSYHRRVAILSGLYPLVAGTSALLAIAFSRYPR